MRGMLSLIFLPWGGLCEWGLLLPGCLALAVAIGCSPLKVGEVRIESESVPLGQAKSVRIDLTLAVGTLNLSGRGKGLVDADFVYNVPEWRPDVRYEVDKPAGWVSIKQPGNAFGPLGNTRNEWNLSLNGDVPTDLNVELGVGKSRLELGEIQLQQLSVQTGVGEAVLDLVGAWKKDLHARIKGGVGEVTVRLPSDVGVRVDASKGIGSIKATGLKQDNNVFTNESYGKSEINLNIRIEAGVGTIRLEAI
ncbi:MAG: toast rack family protein [Acidobacteriota bacterium]